MHSRRSLKKTKKNPKHLIIRSLAIKLSLLFKDRVYFSKGDVTRSCWQYRSFTFHSIKSSSVKVLSFERSGFLFHWGPKTAAQSVSQNLSSPGNHPVSRWPLTLAAFLYALTCFPLIYLMLNKLSSPLNHCCVCSHRLTLTRPVLRRARAWSTKPRPLVLAVVCLFVCKYGLSYMFTFLWASTLSLFFSPIFWMVISVNLFSLNVNTGRA